MQGSLRMRSWKYYSALLKDAAAGRHLFSIFIPVVLWGDLFDVHALETKRVYRPTAAQLRLEKQNKEQEMRIQAIRSQRTPQTVRGKTAAAGNVRTSAAASPADRDEPPRIRYIWYKSSRFVLLQDIARYYGMKITYTPKGVVLKSPRDTIVLLYEKRLAYMNQVSTYLTHAPVLRGALVYLNEMDFLLIVDPVIRNAPLWKHPLKTILIDPGHGGKDQGAPGTGGLLEKNITLSIACKLAVKLRKCGFRVFMTRIHDRQLTLQQRVAMCEQLKPDLFVSIHCNAVGNKKTQGIETYAATPQGAASTSDSKPVAQFSAGNSFNRNNYRLAYEIQKNLLTETRAADRGVRHARFFVIRNATCPSVLIETGFLTHQKEGRLLNTPVYQDRIVEGICRGITSYAKASALPVKSSSLKKAAGK